MDRYPDWYKLKQCQMVHLTDEEYTPLNGEKLAFNLVPKLLLKLCDVFHDYDPQSGKVLCRMLAACRLVCRRWSKIVTSERRRFIIRANGKEWLSPSWFILRRTPLLLMDRKETHQETCFRWLPKTYSASLSKWRRKFPPELLPDMIQGLYKRRNEGDIGWERENQPVIQRTLVACCLVSREWNRISTPVLFGDIFLGVKNPLLAQSLLHRTFRHTQPAHKALVKTMTIAPAEDGSTANLLSICFSMPNLRKLILDFGNFDLSALHCNFVQQLRSLSKCCSIQMLEDDHGNVALGWAQLPSYINFTRGSRSTSLSFGVTSSLGT